MSGTPNAVHYLHTDSSYVMGDNGFGRDSLDNLLNSPQELLMMDIKRAYYQLLDREQAFYNRFGYSSADAFFKGIRNIMLESAKDFQILNNFDSNHISAALQKFKNYNNNHFINHMATISFECKDKPGELIMNELSKLGGKNITFTGGKLTLGFEWNNNRLKHIVNIAKNKHFKDKSKMDGIFNYIKSNPDIVQLTVHSNQTSSSQNISILDNPFSYTSNELGVADKQILTNLKNQIINFIYQDLGINNGSTELKIASKNVIDATIANKITDISFFEGGHGGWISHLIGAFGEFRAAVFFDYLAMKCPNKEIANHISQIIGNQSGSNSQQYHSDLQILESFGIQVKNYNSDIYNWGSKAGQEKEVTVALHPLEIAPLMKDEEAVSYLINSYFNTSVESVSPNDLEPFFEANALELLNLNLSTALNIPAKVNFYLVGNSLIPGSEIIRQGFLEQEKTIMVSGTTIQGRKGSSDAQYNDKSAHPFRGLHWWHGNEKGGWLPTSENTLSAWDRNISIRTKFTYKAFWDSGSFNIF